jgi:hypothetical protein
MDELNPSGGGSGKGRKILIGLLALLLVGSIGIYVSGVSLKSLLFGISSQEGEKVGVVKAVTGQLKRQPKDSLEFLDAKMTADLFNEDTVMTGPDDHATIELFDGSVLELDPGSLIRLSFESAQGVGGIERRVLVDIVAGNVKGDMSRPKLVVRRGGQPVPRPSPRPVGATPAPVATPTAPPVSPAPSSVPTAEPSPEPAPSLVPSPEPSPTPEPSPSPTPAGLKSSDLRITSPSKGQVFTLTATQKPPLKQSLVFESPGIPDASVMMVLKNSSGKEILRKTVTATRGRGGLLATFERPGAYSVELRNPDGSRIGRGISAAFAVASEYSGIETQTPLVGGEPIDSNKFTGKRLKDFDVQLRWKAIEGIAKYRVVVMGKGSARAVDEVVSGTSYSMPKEKISTDALTYQIRADFPGGYSAVSKRESFLFNFLSPALTLPKDGEAVSLADPEIVKQKGVFFSWQRTTFTQTYEFEIAFDAQFTNVMKHVSVRAQDNFLVFRNLKPRDYWWRVRAASGELKSAPGKPFKMTVTP